jgi:excisionase family DNA binding protein
MEIPKEIESNWLLRAAEVAERLQVSETHVYALMKSVEIPAVRVGKRTVRVKPNDLEAYINNNSSNSSLS